MAHYEGNASYFQVVMLDQTVIDRQSLPFCYETPNFVKKRELGVDSETAGFVSLDKNRYACTIIRLLGYYASAIAELGYCPEKNNLEFIEIECPFLNVQII